MNLDLVILAAGKGTRMRSSLAKVLHPLGGKPLLKHAVETASGLAPRQTCIVIGHQGQAVQDAMAGTEITWVEQAEQLGTGHAVGEAMAHLPVDGIVLVLYGDVPLVEASTLARAVAVAEQGHVGLVTAVFKDPAELGRIVRDEEGLVQAIVEYKDADSTTRGITEINSGIMALPAADLIRWLAQLNTDNAQGELYLTDVIAMAVGEGQVVESIQASPHEVIGINDRVQLAEVERIYQRLRVEEIMLGGVTVADPSRVDIRGELIIGEDSYLDVNVVFEGAVTIGPGCRIGAGAIIQDSAIGPGTVVHPHSTIEGATIAANCSVGPFARIRPETVLEEGVKIGNFVETKKSHLGPGTKAGHLAYIGDATLGANCNVGAGAVTANYDGVNKFETKAGDHVFVGTNVTMVAPLELKDWAFLAAGSTVTNDVGENDLAVGRGKQRNLPGWKRPDQQAKDKSDGTASE
jgi:bifunctional UDP-N-acetylglucosamine pyrophosphorylase/glucosamine-1-phosphate N-acetyltransferase